MQLRSDRIEPDVGRIDLQALIDRVACRFEIAFGGGIVAFQAVLLGASDGQFGGSQQNVGVVAGGLNRRLNVCVGLVQPTAFAVEPGPRQQGAMCGTADFDETGKKSVDDLVGFPNVVLLRRKGRQQVEMDGIKLGQHGIVVGRFDRSFQVVDFRLGEEVVRMRTHQSHERQVILDVFRIGAGGLQVIDNRQRIMPLSFLATGHEGKQFGVARCCRQQGRQVLLSRLAIAAQSEGQLGQSAANRRRIGTVDVVAENLIERKVGLQHVARRTGVLVDQCAQFGQGIEIGRSKSNILAEQRDGFLRVVGFASGRGPFEQSVGVALDLMGVQKVNPDRQHGACTDDE